MYEEIITLMKFQLSKINSLIFSSSKEIIYVNIYYLWTKMIKGRLVKYD